MRKLLTLLTLLSTSAFAGGVEATPPVTVKAKPSTQLVQADHYYVSLKGGLNAPFDSNADGVAGDINLNKSEAFNVAFGKYFSRNVRGEIELGYSDNTFTGTTDSYCPISFNGKLYSYSAFTNAYYDIGSYAGFVPYVGAGVGITQQHAEVGIYGLPFGASDTSFAYQGIVGASYPIANRWSLTGEYRYVGQNDPSFAGVDSEYSTQQALLGVRFDL